jgi:acyl dehydratase
MKYEEVVVGAEIDRREFEVTPEIQRDYLEALEEGNALYVKGDSSEGPIAHPVVILNRGFASEWIGSFSEHIHAKNYVKFLSPTGVGKKVFSRSTVYGKYVRRGRRYVATKFMCVDEDGKELLRCIWTETHGVADELGENTPSRKSNPGAGVENCDVFGKPKKITLELMRKFSGHLGGGENVHTSEKAAKEYGLPGPIAQGMMSYGYFLEIIVNAYGAKWLRGGELEAKFTRYVAPGDTISAKGILRPGETDRLGSKIVLDVWCENQHKEKVAVGTAFFDGIE